MSFKNSNKIINWSTIDKTWTLFLDRDGVINQEKKDDYIRNVSEFVMYKGVPKAIAKLSHVFGRTFIVTNQKGIGRGLMTLEDLEEIHQHLIISVVNEGGHIDKIYFCPDLSNDSPNRKPNAGMAFNAKKDFPEIDFSKSIMIGNKLSDMQFGRNAGIKTVFVATTNPETMFPNPLIDFKFEDLVDFANLF